MAESDKRRPEPAEGQRAEDEVIAKDRPLYVISVAAELVTCTPRRCASTSAKG